MKLDQATLQYWFAEFNRLIFNNQLENSVILVKDYGDFDETEAEFIQCTDPFVIKFHNGKSMIEEDEPGKVYYLSILLHEMIHQYCYETGIVDIDEIGEHSEEFKNAAYEHEMIQDGYKLSEKIETTIKNRMKAFDAVASIR